MQVKTILQLIDEEQLPEQLTEAQWESLKQQSAAGMSFMLRALVASVKDSLKAKMERAVAKPVKKMLDKSEKE